MNKLIKEFSKTLIIFDFDGVLKPDTAKAIETHLEVAVKMNLPLTKEVLIKHWGKVWESSLIPDIAKEMGWPSSVQAEFIKLAIGNSVLSYNGNPYPKIKQALDSLGTVDKTILTSREKTTLDILLDKMEIREKFIYLQSADCCRYHKPLKEAFQPTLDFINHKKYDRIFYVGDTIDYDYAPIRDYFPEIIFIGVESILVSREEFKQAGVEYVINDISEIFDIINN